MALKTMCQTERGLRRVSGSRWFDSRSLNPEGADSRGDNQPPSSRFACNWYPDAIPENQAFFLRLASASVESLQELTSLWPRLPSFVDTS